MRQVRRLRAFVLRQDVAASLVGSRVYLQPLLALPLFVAQVGLRLAVNELHGVRLDAWLEAPTGQLANAHALALAFEHDRLPDLGITALHLALDADVAVAARFRVLQLRLEAHKRVQARFNLLAGHQTSPTFSPAQRAMALASP